MSFESVMPSNHLILSHPLLLLPSIFPSIRVFSEESFLCIRWPKYWSFSFSISPSNERLGLISFRMDWLDLLADPPAIVFGAENTTLQHWAAALLDHMGPQPDCTQLRSTDCPSLPSPADITPWLAFYITGHLSSFSAAGSS